MEPAEVEVWTVGRVLRWTQQRFAARGIASPRLDAELLLAAALAKTLGGSRVALYTHFEQPLEKDELSRFRDLIKRRLEGMPVAYLTGEKEFFGLPLKVSPAVLVPRPETELLVEVALGLLPAGVAAASGARAQPGVELHVAYEEPAVESEPLEGSAELEAGGASSEDLALSAAKAGEPSKVPEASEETPSPVAPVATVVDVGTGSGAVALAIAHRRRDIKVIGIDASPDALAVATKNVQQLGLCVELLQGDLLAPLKKGAKVDLIVANLPYIPTADIAKLSPEVRSEPLSALDGGPDGLVPIRRLISQAQTALRPGGALALEVGDGQAGDVETLLGAAGFVGVRSERDLAQIPRVVLGHRPG